MFLKPDERADKIIRAAVRFDLEFRHLLSDGIDFSYALKNESAILARNKLVYLASLSQAHLFNVSESESIVRLLNAALDNVTLERIRMLPKRDENLRILERMSTYFPEYIEVVQAEIEIELRAKWCRQQESNLRPLHYQ